MFDYKMNINEKLLEIIINGEFDTEGAQKVQDALATYKGSDICKVMFDLSKATVMASSGLRVIYFAKDHIIKGIQIDVIGAKGIVMKVLKMSGIGKFVNIVE